ncbi:MAG: MCT family MFS transporter [Dehalococcoidia bacterium]
MAGTKTSADAAPRIFYGWFVVAGTFVILFLGFGAAYSFASFFPALRDSFDASRGDTSLVFSIAGFLYFSLGAISGPLADRIGPRRVALFGVVTMAVGLVLASFARELWQVYLTYSLAVGVGLGAAYVPAVSAIQRWFVRRRGLASGIAVSGIGLGTLCMPLITTWIIETAGWERAYLVLGIAMAAGGIPAALLVEHSPARRALGPDGDTPVPIPAGSSTAVAGFSAREAIRTRTFVLFYGAAAASGLALFIPFAHLVPYAKDHGLSTTRGALLVGCIGIGSTLGRLATGPVADRFGRRQSLAVAFGAMALDMCFWLVAEGLWSLTLFALVFGAAYGAYVALAPPLTADFFGGRNVGSILGILYTGAAFGALIGPTLAGAIYDVRESYVLPIAFGAAMSLLATVLVLGLRPPPPRRAPLA